MPNCARCGRQLRDGAKFCSVCGVPVSAALAVPTPGTPALSQDDVAAVFLLFPDECRNVIHPYGAIIGRAAGCNIVLPNDSVSTRHAEIARGGTGYILRDLGSHNGIWLSRQRLTEVMPLNSGDEIALGETLCAFGLAGATLSPSVTPSETRSIAVPVHTGFPAALPGASPLLAPVQPDASISLRDWNPPPQTEGKVLDVQGPIMEKKSDIDGKVALVIGLALIMGALYQGEAYAGVGHAVWVTGVEIAPAGQISSVTINDSNHPESPQSYDYATFKTAWDGSNRLLVAAGWLKPSFITEENTMPNQLKAFCDQLRHLPTLQCLIVLEDVLSYPIPYRSGERLTLRFFFLFQEQRERRCRDRGALSPPCAGQRELSGRQTARSHGFGLRKWHSHSALWGDRGALPAPGDGGFELCRGAGAENRVFLCPVAAVAPLCGVGGAHT